MSGAAVAAGLRRTWLVASGIALSACSLAIVLYSANAEPFVVFGGWDLASAGLLSALAAGACVAFTIWVAACVLYLRPVSLARASRAGLALSCLIWTALNLFYLGTTAYGIVQDLNNPYLPRWRCELFR